MSERETYYTSTNKHRMGHRGHLATPPLYSMYIISQREYNAIVSITQDWWLAYKVYQVSQRAEMGSRHIRTHTRPHVHPYIQIRLNSITFTAIHTDTHIHIRTHSNRRAQTSTNLTHTRHTSTAHEISPAISNAWKNGLVVEAYRVVWNGTGTLAKTPCDAVGTIGQKWIKISLGADGINNKEHEDLYFYWLPTDGYHPALKLHSQSKLHLVKRW